MQKVLNYGFALWAVLLLDTRKPFGTDGEMVEQTQLTSKHSCESKLSDESRRSLWKSVDLIVRYAE